MQVLKVPYFRALHISMFNYLPRGRVRRHKPKTIEQAKLLIDNFNNHERIQFKTKLTPLEKRRQCV